MDTVRATSEVELVFVTVWRIRLAPHRSILYIMWLNKLWIWIWRVFIAGMERLKEL